MKLSTLQKSTLKGCLISEWYKIFEEYEKASDYQLKDYLDNKMLEIEKIIRMLEDEGINHPVFNMKYSDEKRISESD